MSLNRIISIFSQRRKAWEALSARWRRAGKPYRHLPNRKRDSRSFTSLALHPYDTLTTTYHVCLNIRLDFSRWLRLLPLLLLPSSATKSGEQPPSNSVMIHISKIAKLFTAAVSSRLRGRNTCKISYSFICIIRRVLNTRINANWVCITCSSFSEKKW